MTKTDAYGKKTPDGSYIRLNALASKLWVPLTVLIAYSPKFLTIPTAPYSTPNDTIPA